MDFPHVVLARLYEHIEPIDRGERYEDSLQFGRQQCLAISLDGTTLPDEVYADLDFEAVETELGAAAGEGSSRGFWQGPEETGLYFFGPDAEAMFARVHPVLRRLPIGQNARVVLRYGKQELNPRDVRMPKH